MSARCTSGQKMPRISRIALGLVVALMIVSDVSAVPISMDARCAPQCSGSRMSFHGDYKVGKSYKYSFTSEHLATIANATENTVTLSVTGTAKIEGVMPCEQLLKLEDIVMTETLMGIDAENQEKTYDMAKDMLEKTPIRFGLDNGKVTAVCPDPSDSKFAVNFKRGIISQFVNSFETEISNDIYIPETDVTGTCLTEYVKETGESLNEDQYKFKKIKAISGCSNKHQFVSALGGVSDNQPKDYTRINMADGDYTCSIVQQKNSGPLLASVCIENHRFNPMSRTGDTVTIHINQKIEYVETTDLAEATTSVIGVVSDLLFDHTPYKPAELLNTEIEILNTMCEALTSGNLQDVPPNFMKLVQGMRLMTAEEIKELHKSLMGGTVACESADLLSIFHDALPMVQTEASVTVIIDHLTNTEDAFADENYWLRTLLLIKDPTAEMIKTIGPYMRKNYKASLYVSSLIKRFCAKRPDCPDLLPVLKMPFTDFGAKCAPANQEEKTRTLTILRSLSNLPVFNTVGLLDCYNEPETPTEIKLGVLDIIRSYPQNDDFKAHVEAVFQNVLEMTEVRIKAYQAMMNKPEFYGLSIITETIRREESEHLKSYIFTHLGNLAVANELDRQVQRKAAITLLSNLRKVNFKTDIRSYSRNYIYNVGRSILMDADVIFAQDSFIPRSICVNMTSEALGRQMNVMELDLRMENLEQLVTMPKPSNSSSKYSNYDNIISSWLGKSKAGATPSISFGARLFGNDVVFAPNLNLLTMMEMRTKALESMQEGLTLDKYRTVNILDVSLSTPTMTGMPIEMKVDLIATAKIGLNLKLSPISAKVKGYMAARMQGQFRLNAHCTKIGTQSTLDTMVRREIDVKMEDSKVILAPVDYEQKLFKADADVALVTGFGDILQMGKGERVNQTFCSSSLIKEKLDIGYCINYTHPRANPALGDPSFPFAGPSRVDISLGKHSGLVLEMKTSSTEEGKSLRMAVGTAVEPELLLFSAEKEMNGEDSDYNIELNTFGAKYKASGKRTPKSMEGSIEKNGEKVIYVSGEATNTSYSLTMKGNKDKELGKIVYNCADETDSQCLLDIESAIYFPMRIKASRAKISTDDKTQSKYSFSWTAGDKKVQHFGMDYSDTREKGSYLRKIGYKWMVNGETIIDGTHKVIVKKFDAFSVRDPEVKGTVYEMDVQNELNGSTTDLAMAVKSKTFISQDFLKFSNSKAKAIEHEASASWPNNDVTHSLNSYYNMKDITNGTVFFHSSCKWPQKSIDKQVKLDSMWRMEYTFNSNMELLYQSDTNITNSFKAHVSTSDSEKWSSSLGLTVQSQKIFSIEQELVKRNKNTIKIESLNRTYLIESDIELYKSVYAKEFNLKCDSVISVDNVKQFKMINNLEYEKKEGLLKMKSEHSINSYDDPKDILFQMRGEYEIGFEKYKWFWYENYILFPNYLDGGRGYTVGFGLKSPKNLVAAFIRDTFKGSSNETTSRYGGSIDLTFSKKMVKTDVEVCYSPVCDTLSFDSKIKENKNMEATIEFESVTLGSMKCELESSRKDLIFEANDKCKMNIINWVAGEVQNNFTANLGESKEFKSVSSFLDESDNTLYQTTLEFKSENYKNLMLQITNNEEAALRLGFREGMIMGAIDRSKSEEQMSFTSSLSYVRIDLDEKQNINFSMSYNKKDMVGKIGLEVNLYDVIRIKDAEITIQMDLDTNMTATVKMETSVAALKKIDLAVDSVYNRETKVRDITVRYISSHFEDVIIDFNSTINTRQMVGKNMDMGLKFLAECNFFETVNFFIGFKNNVTNEDTLNVDFKIGGSFGDRLTKFNIGWGKDKGNINRSMKYNINLTCKINETFNYDFYLGGDGEFVNDQPMSLNNKALLNNNAIFNFTVDIVGRIDAVFLFDLSSFNSSIPVLNIQMNCDRIRANDFTSNTLIKLGNLGSTTLKVTYFNGMSDNKNMTVGDIKAILYSMIDISTSSENFTKLFLGMTLSSDFTLETQLELDTVIQKIPLIKLQIDSIYEPTKLSIVGKDESYGFTMSREMDDNGKFTLNAKVSGATENSLLRNSEIDISFIDYTLGLLIDIENTAILNISTQGSDLSHLIGQMAIDVSNNGKFTLEGTWKNPSNGVQMLDISTSNTFEGIGSIPFKYRHEYSNDGGEKNIQLNLTISLTSDMPKYVLNAAAATTNTMVQLLLTKNDLTVIDVNYQQMFADLFVSNLALPFVSGDTFIAKLRPEKITFSYHCKTNKIFANISQELNGDYVSTIVFSKPDYKKSMTTNLGNIVQNIMTKAADHDYYLDISDAFVTNFSRKSYGYISFEFNNNTGGSIQPTQIKLDINTSQYNFDLSVVTPYAQLSNVAIKCNATPEMTEKYTKLGFTGSVEYDYTTFIDSYIQVIVDTRNEFTSKSNFFVDIKCPYADVLDNITMIEDSNDGIKYYGDFMIDFKGQWDLNVYKTNIEVRDNYFKYVYDNSYREFILVFDQTFEITHYEINLNSRRNQIFSYFNNATDCYFVLKNPSRYMIFDGCPSRSGIFTAANHDDSSKIVINYKLNSLENKLELESNLFSQPITIRWMSNYKKSTITITNGKNDTDKPWFTFKRCIPKSIISIFLDFDKEYVRITLQKKSGYGYNYEYTVETHNGERKVVLEIDYPNKFLLSNNKTYQISMKRYADPSARGMVTDIYYKPADIKFYAKNRYQRAPLSWSRNIVTDLGEYNAFIKANGPKSLYAEINRQKFGEEKTFDLVGFGRLDFENVLNFNLDWSADIVSGIKKEIIDHLKTERIKKLFRIMSENLASEYTNLFTFEDVKTQVPMKMIDYFGQVEAAYSSSLPIYKSMYDKDEFLMKTMVEMMKSPKSSPEESESPEVDVDNVDAMLSMMRSMIDDNFDNNLVDNMMQVTANTTRSAFETGNYMLKTMAEKMTIKKMPDMGNYTSAMAEKISSLEVPEWMAKFRTYVNTNMKTMMESMAEGEFTEFYEKEGKATMAMISAMCSNMQDTMESVRSLMKWYMSYFKSTMKNRMDTSSMTSDTMSAMMRGDFEKVYEDMIKPEKGYIQADRDKRQLSGSIFIHPVFYKIMKRTSYSQSIMPRISLADIAPSSEKGFSPLYYQLRYLYINYGSSRLLYKNAIPPYKQEAWVIGWESIITYNNAIYSTTKMNCSYLVTRNFVTKDFSIVSDKQNNRFAIESGQHTAYIYSDGRVTSMVEGSDDINQLSLPAKINDMLTVTLDGQRIRAVDSRGVEVNFFTKMNTLQIIVDGSWYGQMGGSAGYNDMGNKGDLVIPVLDVTEDVDKMWSFGCELEQRKWMSAQIKSEVCNTHLRGIMSQFSSCFPIVNPKNYLAVCTEAAFTNNSVCNVLEAYALKCRNAGISAKSPAQCLKCEDNKDKMPMMDMKPHFHYLFLVEDSSCMLNYIPTINKISAYLAKQRKADKFSLITFNGNQPSSQHTNVKGKTFYSQEEMVKLLSALSSNSTGREGLQSIEALVSALKMPQKKNMRHAIYYFSCARCRKHPAYEHETLKMLMKKNLIPFMYFTTHNFGNTSIVGMSKSNHMIFEFKRHAPVINEGIYGINSPKDACSALVRSSDIGYIWSISNIAQAETQNLKIEPFYKTLSKYSEDNLKVKTQCNCVADAYGSPQYSCHV